MRSDGRQDFAVRQVAITPAYTKHAEGSALITMGDTWVLCTASIEDKAPQFLSGTDSGWIKAEYALLPRSTHTRTARETNHVGGRTHEIQRIIGRSLRAGVNLRAINGYTIFIDCDVMQADGGTRTAAITGAWVALHEAFRFLFGSHLPADLLKTQLLAGLSVGKVDGRLLADLNYDEDHQAEADMNVVMTGEGNFAEIQCTSEHGLISPQDFNQMLQLAQAGIKELFAAQHRALLGSA